MKNNKKIKRIVTGMYLTGASILGTPITAMADEPAGEAAVPDIMTTILNLITKFAIIGGGLWAVWGVVILAGGLKDKNGPALQSGIWQIIGGGLIIAAAALFNTVV